MCVVIFTFLDESWENQMMWTTSCQVFFKIYLVHSFVMIVIFVCCCHIEIF
jgi:hypothetical protein